mmetsp:Transcript_8229/g.17866  ORF Transcript_8229/g.17866 Transcript_8229/m.17866 type:complete len:98 (+) Transcript_8229:193-486(+)
MIHPTIVYSDWSWMQEAQRQNQNTNNVAENRNRIKYTYKIGYMVLIKINRSDGKHELDRLIDGPFEILALQTKGTVQMQRDQFKEWINIRRIYPYTK